MPGAARVLINGAGPAGLTAAIVLARQGFRVEVAEAAPDRSVLGSELLLSSPLLRSLDEIGVADAVVARGAPLDTFELRTATDAVVGESHRPKVTRDDLPSGVGIARQALRDVLYDEATASGAMIHHGTELSDLTRRGAIVEALFRHGPSGDHDLVIGADGIQSHVRDLAFAEPDEPRYAGQCVWRARAPRLSDKLCIWIGNKALVGIVPVASDASYLFCLVPSERPPRHHPDELLELLLQDLAEFRDGVVGRTKEHLGAHTPIHFSPIRSLLVDDPWHRDRVLLIGDAAHATTPHLAYGAGVAIEDGVVLGQEMEGCRDLDRALDSFMARRFERCRMVVEAGVQISRWQQQGDPDGSLTRGRQEEVWSELLRPI